MKSPEQFNPADEKYKKVADLPEVQRKNFVDEKDGFIRKEVLESDTELSEEAKRRNKERPILQKLLGKGEVSLLEIVHEKGIEMNGMLDGYLQKITQKEKEIQQLQVDLKKSSDEILTIKKQRDEYIEKTAMFQEAENDQKLKDMLGKMVREQSMDVNQGKKEYEEIMNFSGSEIEQDLEQISKLNLRLYIPPYNRWEPKVAPFNSEVESAFEEYEKAFNSSGYSFANKKIEQTLDGLTGVDCIPVIRVSAEDEGFPWDVMDGDSYRYYPDKKYDQALEKIEELKAKLAEEFRQKIESAIEVGSRAIIFSWASCDERKCNRLCAEKRVAFQKVVGMLQKKYENKPIKIIPTIYFGFNFEKNHSDQEPKEVLATKSILEEGIIEKMGKSKPEVENELKKYLYNKMIDKGETASSLEMGEYSVDADGDYLSKLLLSAYVTGDMPYREFLEKMKGIDSEISQSVFEHLKKIETEQK